MRSQDIPGEVRCLHGRLSQRAVDLLERFEPDPEGTRSRSSADSDLPAWVLAYPFPRQEWPTFVGGPKLEEMRTAAVEIGRLVREVPERLLDGDPQRVSDFYGLHPDLAALLLTEPRGIDEAICRGDFIDTEDGFQCVEMNLDACLGGWQLRYFVQRFFDTPWIAEIALREPLARYVDPLPVLFKYVVTNALDAGLGEGGCVNLALLASDELLMVHRDGAIAALAAEYRRFLESCDPPLAGELVFAGRQDVALRDGAAVIGGRRIDIVIDYDKPELSQELFRSFKAGLLHHYNGPAVALLRDKRNLALLSEHAESDRFDARERALIQAHVPWTRVLRDEPTTRRGERIDLRRFVLSSKDDLVLKPARGFGGSSVWIGRQVEANAWEELVGRAISEGTWLIQERVQSVPYWYRRRDDGVPGPHDVVWGLFGFGDLYGGGFLRMVPCGGDGVINSAKGATEGLILEIEER